MSLLSWETYGANVETFPASGDRTGVTVRWCPLSLGQYSTSIKNYVRVKFYEYEIHFTTGISKLPGLVTRLAAFLSLRTVAGEITITSTALEQKSECSSHKEMGRVYMDKHACGAGHMCAHFVYKCVVARVVFLLCLRCCPEFACLFVWDRASH